MKKLTTRWYYSLVELTHEAMSAWEIVYADGAPTVGMAAWLRELATHYNISSVSNPWNTYDTTENKKMWADYLWPEFRESIMMYVDVEHAPWSESEEPTDEEIGDELNGVLSRMARWLKESTERYSILIQNYELIENNLLAKVATITDSIGSNDSETTQTNNDTPQEGGNYLSDPYVNNASHSEGAAHLTSNSVTATDLTTPIERLNEIRQKLHNLYADWADEFARFVIYSAE